MRAENEKPRPSTILLVTIAVVFSFALSFFLGQSGIFRLRQMQHEYDGMIRSNQQYVLENRDMAREIKRLRHDPAAIEKIAREELHYVAPHDVILIVPDHKPPAER